MKSLEFGTKHETHYAVPLWLRDEQIRLASRRPIRRLETYTGPLRTEPIAIVCFGPSLNDTWEEIRNFKWIITCSGSHRFLLDRGIVPTWHVEVDPREHKVALLGEPDPRVEYLVASTCHPAYFDHLKDGPNVVLWHIFQNEPDAYRVLPRGEWYVLGGTNVGLRAMALARLFGFRNQVIFGMDGCQRDEVHKHATAHPLQDGTPFSTVEYDGVEYKTTAAMLESAKGTFYELDTDLHDVTAEFRGEGLVQAMARNYVRKERDPGRSYFLAIQPPELISAEYRELNARLHRESLAYGVGGGRYAGRVEEMARGMKTTSVLDYGCGKGYLGRAMPWPIWEYDPAVPGKDDPPRPADLVVCLDVLEHIEPDKILFVLEDLARVTRQVGYFVVHTGPSKKKLADGRNAHLIQQPLKWWSKRIGIFFQVAKVFKQGPLLHYVVGPKPHAKAAARVA